LVALASRFDVADAWEFADDSRYPEKYSHMAISIGGNYVVHAMTH